MYKHTTYSTRKTRHYSWASPETWLCPRIVGFFHVNSAHTLFVGRSPGNIMPPRLESHLFILFTVLLVRYLLYYWNNCFRYMRITRPFRPRTGPLGRSLAIFVEKRKQLNEHLDMMTDSEWERYFRLCRGIRYNDYSTATIYPTE